MIVFIGISIDTSRNESVYTVTLSFNGQPHQSFSRFTTILSVHRLTLTAIRDLCRAVVESSNQNSKTDLVIYSGSHLIEFEWNEEYRKDHRFDANTRDIDLWKEIIGIVDNNPIDITIYGNQMQNVKKERSDTNAK